MRREPRTVGAHIDDGVLLRYRAQQLDAETERGIDEHLATCSECRALLLALAEPVAEKQRSWAQAELSAARRGRWIGLAAGLAAVAAVLLFVLLRPPPRDFAEYRLDGLHGLVKVERAASAPQTDRVTPDSHINLRLLPPEPKDEVLAAGVFAVAGGKLTRVPAQIRQRRGVFAVEVGGRDLFGTTYGPRRMVVVLAGDEAALAALDGASATSSGPGLRAWSFDLTYEAGGLE